MAEPELKESPPQAGAPARRARDDGGGVIRWRGVYEDAVTPDERISANIRGRMLPVHPPDGWARRACDPDAGGLQPNPLSGPSRALHRLHQQPHRQVTLRSGEGLLSERRGGGVHLVFNPRRVVIVLVIIGVDVCTEGGGVKIRTG